MRTRYKAATILAAAAIIGSTAGPASASTAGTVHYYANDVAGTGRFGPAITGSAAEGIATLAERYERDPATFAQVAAFAGFRLPGGTAYLLAHRGRQETAAVSFYAFMRATIREEVTWTSPYRTEYAIPHGNEPTTFGWTSMPDVTRNVLVFTWGALVMQCGGQPYIPAKRIPLPSRPKHCATGGFQPACTPCPAGTRLFTIPGIGRMCLCPLSVLVTVTTTVTTTTTTVVTTTTTYGVCPPKKHGKKVKPCSSGG
jgi:hypothetical protein